MKKFTHLDEKYRPRMVDVTGKIVSCRIAVAEGFIRLQSETLKLIRNNRIKKGNVLIIAELAGVQAAKQTALLIPLCHQLALSKVNVEAVLQKNGISITSEIKCLDRTGVEMEALTAVSIALLTVYDMCKAVDKKMRIMNIKLLKKTKHAVDAMNQPARKSG